MEIKTGPEYFRSGHSKKKLIIMKTKIIQITSGKGPAECELAVALALKEMIREARSSSLHHEVISRFAGDINGTLSSATIKLEGKNLEAFLGSWQGVLLWISQSPYRKMHKRKNWYIGINEIANAAVKELEEKEITFQTMRSSGPGGQNVNKTETAVRATHKPSGLSASCDSYRSQLQNKNEAAKRLKEKYKIFQRDNCMKQELRSPQENNNNLDRGNPVRIYKGEKFLKE